MEFFVITCHQQITDFIRLIKRLDKINNFNFKTLKIILDFQLDPEVGIFYYSRPNTIFINTNKCDENGEFSPFYILIHEFSHLLDRKLKIKQKYLKFFRKKKNRLYICKNSKKNIDEEVAEILTIYLTNPFLLSLVSKKHYLFFKGLFKSPTKYSKKTFLKEYPQWTTGWKKQVRRRYGFYVRAGKIIKQE